MNTFSAKGIGQLFLVKLEEGRWSRSLESMLRSIQPAGVIIVARHLRSLDNVGYLLRRISRVLEVSPFLGLVGDRVQPDPRRSFLPLVPAVPLPIDAASKGIKAVETLARLRGAILSMHGFNVDFGLSLDLTPADSRTAFAACTFGSDPAVVAGCGDAYLRGLRRHKVLACARHFPGLGSVEVHPHTQSPLSSKPMAGLWREDLVPFRELLPRLPLVIVSSAAYKAYDFDPPRPALLSANVVHGLLRTKLGYQGLAVADIAVLEATQKRLEPGDATVRSLDASCDLFVIEGTRNSLDKTMRTVKASLESGRLLTEHLEKSLARINAAKRSLPFPERTTTFREVKQFADRFEKLSKELENYGQGHIGD